MRGNLYSGCEFDTWYGEVLFLILFIIYFYFLITYFNTHTWLIILSFPLGLFCASLCDALGSIIKDLIKNE